MGIKLAAESVVRHGELFLALDARSDARSVTREALVRIASRIEMEWLEELFPQSIRKVRDAVFDAQRQRVVGRAATYYLDLLLREEITGDIDPAAGAAALFDALRPRVNELIASDEQLASLYRRVEMLECALPSHLWPSKTSTLGVPSPDQLLQQACDGATSVADVTSRLHDIAVGSLTYEARQLLNDQAPESLAVPTGNRIKLDWSTASVDPLRGPVLAVRLQEVFGWTDTPRLIGGVVPVVMHLLGPNYRPVQVTQDLRSFWTTTYFQVRKDLKARYPKHSWPEDPLTAKPQAKGRSRK
jgi:ATP-dependent helicase HrpB